MKLDDILKQARVPERSPGYWEHFAQRVTRQLSASPRPSRQWLPWAVGLTACVAVAGFLVARSSRLPAPAPVSYAQLYDEIAELFPNQVQAIVVDGYGVKLQLAETANVPRSHPLLVRACRQDDCRHVITFSGQQVKINGDAWDVLLNGQNDVVVAGRSTDRYRIEARRLEEIGIHHGDTEARSL